MRVSHVIIQALAAVQVLGATHGTDAQAPSDSFVDFLLERVRKSPISDTALDKTTFAKFSQHTRPTHSLPANLPAVPSTQSTQRHGRMIQHGQAHQILPLRPLAGIRPASVHNLGRVGLRAEPSSKEQSGVDRVKELVLGKDRILQNNSEGMGRILQNNSEAIVQVVNGAIVLVFLRTLVPRIIAAESTGDLSELAQAVGLPSKEELAGYLAQMQETALPVKLAIFFGIFLVEKVFVLSTVPFLPLTVILPAIAPAVFGNFLAGVLVSLGASTTGAVANFYLGNELVSKKVEDFKVGKNPPIKDSDWYKAIQKATQREPFKTTLLLRLAPILPIPLDAHWYVCGVMKMDPLRFIAAYALGSLKPIFIDAYFGSLLTDPLMDESVKQQSTIVVCLEVAFIVTASIVATSLATSSLTSVLLESNVTLPTPSD